MFRKLFILLFVGLISFSSCTISEHIHFNKDFSGNVSYAFDLSMIQNLAQTDTSDFEGEMEKSMKDAEAELLKIEGVSNIKYSYDSSGLLHISYDFKDVETYNKTLESNESFTKKDSNFPKKHFAIKGSKLIYTEPSMPRDSTYEQMAEMKDMFQYEFKLSFDKEIKKVKFKKGEEDDYEVSSNNKELLKEGNIYDVFPDYETEMIINFKK